MKKYTKLLSAFILVLSVSINGLAQRNNFTGLPDMLPDHPRLFFPRGQEAEILKKAEKNDLLSEMIAVLRIDADKKLSLPLQTIPAGGGLLHLAREQIARVLTLSMAYRLFNDEKYAARVQEELLNVCGYSSWNPGHFLDVAEMTTAVAIGYDWCYDYFTPATREVIEKAILEKAFAPALPIYEREDVTIFNRESNWNMVCNTGMVNGALAIGDKYPVEAELVIQKAIKYIPNILESFAPDGVFNEGPMYWAYNGMFMVLLFDNLNRLLHNDYGLTAYEGLDNTARYYIEQIGSVKKTFNFGNADNRIDYSPTLFYLGRHYKQPQVSAYYRDMIRSAIDEYSLSGEFRFPRLFFLAIPWFDDSPEKKGKAEKLTVFNGITDLIIINGNSKDDDNRLFLAAKTGIGSWAHNHLDGGSFVLDCDGERWGIDMGSSSYSGPGVWDYEPGGGRWNYFMNANQAHSTLSIDNKITNSHGVGHVYKFNKRSSRPFGIFDLSGYYSGEAVSVKRGFKLLGPKTVLIRDELNIKPEPKEVSWRFITNAEVKVNGNTAVLSQNGKTFYIRCLLSDGYSLHAFPAEPSARERPITGVTIVEIKLEPSAGLVTIPVVLTNNIDKFKPGNAARLVLMNWK